MEFDRFSTVLVADACETSAAATVRRLVEAECDVIGPAATARMALALAAQAPIRHAVVAEKLGGVRDGAELARALETTWGVECQIVQEPDGLSAKPLTADEQ